MDFDLLILKLGSVEGTASVLQAGFAAIFGEILPAPQHDLSGVF